VSLFSENRYQDCAGAFRARRQTVETLADSLRNEIDLLVAGEALAGEDEINSSGVYSNPQEFRKEFARLDKMLDEANAGGDRIQSPAEFRITSVYPNPFNGQTVISFNLYETGKVEMSIYNVEGRRIADLTQSNLQAGRHSIVWNADTNPAGIYFIRAATQEKTIISKIVLVK